MPSGIYIHLPYCLTKCPYCDFNSYGVGMNFPEKQYTDSVIREIDMYRDLLGDRRMETVFFGGGTPSLFSPESIERTIDGLAAKCVMEDNTEISMEVNPRTADKEKLRYFRHAGINRISVGVQSFVQKKLDYFKRFCTPSDCKRIISDVEDAGFDNYNLDLMYGADGETVEDLVYDLETAVSHGSRHISVYCLTIEENTEFGRMKRDGVLEMADDDLLSEMYSVTSDVLESRGYYQYETSNFARNGYECRHNLIYWRSGDYFGFGAGSHSHLHSSPKSDFGERWSNNRSPKHYMNEVFSGNKPVDYYEVLDRVSSLQDRLLMGLRLREGLDVGELEQRYGISIDTGEYSYLMEDGFLNADSNRIRLTRKGFLYSNRLILQILSGLSL